jgi:thioredoxin-like negative regulator of GroEL
MNLVSRGAAAALGAGLAVFAFAAHVLPAHADGSAAAAAVAAPAAEPARPKYHVGFVDLPFAKALEKAQAEGKPLLVDLYATWCGPCKEMDENVFTVAAVAEEATNYVALRIDAEKGEGPALYKRFHVTGYPTILFLTPEGREIERVFGSLEADKFLTTLREYRANRGTLADLEDKMAAAGAKATPAMIYEVGLRHALRGDAAAAEKLLGRVAKLDPDNEAGLAAKSLFALGAWLYNAGEDYARATKTLARLLARYPKSPEAKDALKPLAKAYLKLGRAADVRATLDRLIEGETAKSKPYNVYAWFCFQNKFDFGHGVEVAKKGLAIDPKDAGLWDTLAELHFAMGNAAEAVAATKKAIEIDPDDPYFKGQLARFSTTPAKSGGK